MQNNSTDHWKDLAAAAQAGDKRSYQILLKELVPYIQNYLRSSLASPDWVDDITQDVLISVHKSLATFSPDRPFKPWLIAIIGFRRTDFLRKHYNARKNMETTTDDGDYIKEHVTNPTHAGELKDIEKALHTLPEKQRKVFTMVKIEGYTAQEVANEMGMSVSAVKVSAHRTSQKLRDILE